MLILSLLGIPVLLLLGFVLLMILVPPGAPMECCRDRLTGDFPQGSGTRTAVAVRAHIEHVLRTIPEEAPDELPTGAEHVLTCS
jgi:hypothetical protein